MLGTTTRLAFGPLGEEAIERVRAGASYDHRQGKSQCKEVIFDPFSLLGAEPVHEKSVVDVQHSNGDKHVASNPTCGNPAEQSNQEPQATEELGNDGHEC